ncbi:MAG: hypothetical protein ACPGO5_02640 [Patescibacteria group bacterium]
MNYRLLLLIVLSASVLSGCFSLDSLDKTVIEKNKELSEKAEEHVGDDIEAGKERIKEYTKQQIAGIAESLTETAKNEIENWLLENSLNQYGDAEGTMYTGGTPLFDEATGASQDRFEYILEKHPELIEQLGL